MFDEEQKHKEIFILTTNGLHCPVSKPRFMPSSGWYLHKLNKAELAYELGVAIYHDQICWINAPFSAGQNDFKIFSKPDGLKSKIPKGKLVIADEGYTRIAELVSTRNKFDLPDVKDLKKRAKARQATVNARLKSFGILSQVF